MNYCADNNSYILSYLNRKTSSSLVSLSKLTGKKVINKFRVSPVKTNFANKQLMDFAGKESLIVHPKDMKTIYSKASTTDPLEHTQLTTPEELMEWVKLEGIETGNVTVVKHFKSINADYIVNLQQQLHLESGENIVINREMPANVTVGRVRDVFLVNFTSSYLPISNKKAVETVHFFCFQDYDLACLKQFSRLKNLYIYGSGFYSSIKPFLPFVEDLYFEDSNFTMRTEDLRRFVIKNSTIDDKVAAFISQQSRLLSLVVLNVKNANLIRFPSTIKFLQVDLLSDENNALYSKYLAENCEKLNLREFYTNTKLRNVDWLRKKKLNQWGFNSVLRERKQSKFVLKIEENYDPKLPLLECKSDYCEVETADIRALKLMDKDITKIKLMKALSGNTREVPVFLAVKEIGIEYGFSIAQAKLLARIFPQCAHFFLQFITNKN